MTLKDLRTEKGLTQQQTADLLCVSLRTYSTYEKDEKKLSQAKRQFIYRTIEQYGLVDEEHGILSLDKIKQICNEVFSEFNVEYCYLFGSYAKGRAKENSDIDLLVAMPVNSIKFFELVETLREKLKKKIDLLDIGQIENNKALVKEILKDGVKIYG